MKNMIIDPWSGCGEIKFGMAVEEVEALLGIGQYINDPYSDILYGWFQNETIHIGFINNVVVEIEIANSIANTTDIILFGIDVFHNKAEEVIAALEERAACTWDTPDKELSTTYEFSDLGIALWRDHAFHPKLYDNKAYMQSFAKKSLEIQEDEMRFWYFQSIVVKTHNM